MFFAVSLVASAIFVVLVVVVHLLKPEIDPRWRMLSELAIGRYGSVMNVAFVAWSVSNLALAAGLWTLVPNWAAILLALVSLGPLGAAFAVTDPITIPPDAQTMTGKVHTMFGVTFIFGFPVVTGLLAISLLLSGSPLWLVFGVMSTVVWVSLLWFVLVAGRSAQSGRGPGPQSPIGIPNRVFTAAYVAWTVIIALLGMALIG